MTDMGESWPEVRQALVENRYELVLSGADVSKRISDGSIDMSLFSLQNINFLEISKTVLSILPDHVGNLANLTRLVVHSNCLTSLPGTIDKLSKLKNLDVSRNQLETLPPALSTLSQLQVLNVSNNKLRELPDFNGMPNLVTVDASVNCLHSFPLDCTTDLMHLTEIRAKANTIANIPFAINNLSALKLLDLEDNVLAEVPGELGDCGKLKDCNLKGNPLKDRRLRKLVDQCHTKQVLDYVRVHCARDAGEEEEKGASKNKKKGKKKKKGGNDIEKLEDMVNVLHVSDCTPHITITEAARDIRPYIVCCILKDMDLEKGNNFKKFIALQTKLHENECERRNTATIATHDLAKITGNLLYDAQPPPEIKIIPLMRQKEMTAEELFSQLRQEAEALRKEKKRNTFSGIHKYLYLLEGKTSYPCLVDDSGQVISFPPITNSDGTKISTNTTNIFVEVTSSASIIVCKKVMEALILETLRMGLGKLPASKSEEALPSGDIPDGEAFSPNSLTVEQVKVIDKLGQLRSVYPSRTDLQLNGVKIIRSFEN